MYTEIHEFANDALRAPYTLKPVGTDFSQAVAGYKCCTQASLARRSNIMNDR